jgi:hypothetical protein
LIRGDDEVGVVCFCLFVEEGDEDEAAAARGDDNKSI